VNKKEAKETLIPTLGRRPVPHAREAAPKFLGFRVPMIERALASEI